MYSIHGLDACYDSIKRKCDHVDDSQNEHELVARVLHEFFSSHYYHKWDIHQLEIIKNFRREAF